MASSFESTVRRAEELIEEKGFSQAAAIQQAIREHSLGHMPEKSFSWAKFGGTFKSVKQTLDERAEAREPQIGLKI